MDMRNLWTSRSNTFITTDVSASGLQSLRVAGFCFLGTGMTVETLKQRGTWLSWSEELKIAVKTGASWSAQCFRVEEDTPSGPAALRLFCSPNNLLTSHSSPMKGGGNAASPAGEGETHVALRRSKRT